MNVFVILYFVFEGSNYFINNEVLELCNRYFMFFVLENFYFNRGKLSI